MEDAPVVYQESGGVRQPVSGQFVLEGDGQVGFALGAYDHSQPLVIDPVLSYSTYLGGSSNDSGVGIAVDTAGDAYVTGYTESVDFPTTTGALQTNVSGGFSDAFVTKLNPAGTALVYSTYLGGTGDDDGIRHRRGHGRQRLRDGLHFFHQLPDHSRRLSDVPRRRQPTPS